jgi:ketosteroid isomerase-like protein
MRTLRRATISVVALVLLAAACTTASGSEQTAQGSPDPAEKASATLQTNIDAFLAQDVDAVMVTLTKDAEFFNYAMDSHWSGEPGWKTSMKGIFTMTDADATEVIDSFVSDDGTRGAVLVHWIGQNGKDEPFDLTYVQLYEFEDGLISETTTYWMNDDVSDQLNRGYYDS